ncbi:hypothetical protein GGS23DRAFT_345400 [Durotheca rogersii]|uniref:uncharacterized protein n=1 Tax=Durotheca rogersii TaxID=419775 RepID=UPI00221F25BC|nr:uncharacterized protein GGS23DRAFT_345400 [Durotheca rogersii]KAI5857348.1 hypothetical protein GGS23DRAFT_345400 [Durotheca rogersii]
MQRGLRIGTGGKRSSAPRRVATFRSRGSSRSRYRSCSEVPSALRPFLCSSISIVLYDTEHTYGSRLVIDVAKTVKTLTYRVSVRFSTGTGSAPRISTPWSDSFVQKDDFGSLNWSSISPASLVSTNEVDPLDSPISTSRAPGVWVDSPFSTA